MKQIFNIVFVASLCGIVILVFIMCMKKMDVVVWIVLYAVSYLT